jgi:hypothetical protein
MEMSRTFPMTIWLWRRRTILGFSVLVAALSGAILYKAPELPDLFQDWLNRQRAWRIERQELINIAGKNGKDCGYARFSEDPTPANRCALESIAHQKPFYVAYDVQGRDSHLIVGLALDRLLKLSAVKYDSLGWDTSGVKLPGKVMGHVLIRPCEEPHPQVTPRGYLSCEWPHHW